MEDFKIVTHQDMLMFIKALCSFLCKIDELAISFARIQESFSATSAQILTLREGVELLESGADELRCEIAKLEAAAFRFLGESRRKSESVPIFIVRISLIINDAELLSACLRRHNRLMV